GRRVWRFRSIEIVPKKVIHDSKYIYVMEGDYTRHRIHAVSMVSGKKIWSWKAPRGEKYNTLTWDNRHIFLPYLQERSGKVYMVNKDMGITERMFTFQGKRLYDCAFWKGVLVILSDRGDFAYGSINYSQNQREIFVLSQQLKMQGRFSHPRFYQELGALIFQSQKYNKALSVLEEPLKKGWFSFQGEQPLWDQLKGYQQWLAEERYRNNNNIYYVHRTFYPITMDGEIDDLWSYHTRIPLLGPQNIRPVHGKFHKLPYWKGQYDLSGEVYMAWSSQYFYFLIKVYDDVLRAYDNDHPKWIGDCLLMALDFDGSGGYGYRFGDTILTLAFQIPKKKNPKQKKEEEKRRPKGEYFAKRDGQERYTLYEVALPWSMFRKGGALVDPKKGPKEGFTFHFNLVVTDDDGEGQGALKTLNLAPGLLLHKEKRKLWNHFIPYYFAKIRLVK
ncbi:MAG: hypothetical protein D6785_02270, partial [Planctomycetota bacterium]